MKKNSLKKTFSFLAALAVAGSVMTSSVNPAHAKTISSHRSILVGQTITVKVKKGKKQKSSNRKIATVSKKYTKKKKKVTVRRKGKKIRKWKKVKVFKGYFSIRGIRAGQATITIKSGKKTYKFKVTVKNRPASKTSSSSKPSASSSSSSHSSGSVTTNPRPAGMTVPDEPVVSDFYIDKMKNQNVFYNTVKDEDGSTLGGSTVIVRWKTNLKSKGDKVNFYLYNETTNELANGNSGVAKKRYNITNGNDANSTTVKTNDGYAFTITEKKAGTYRYSVAVFGPDNDYRIEKTKYTLPFTVTFKDYKTAENQELKNLINRSGAASEKTVKEKLNALAKYMANTEWNKGGFIHPGNARPGEYADTHGDYGVWFQSRVINCVKATAIIEKCALIFGVPKDGICVESPADNPSHQYALITYKGETFPVDGSPWKDIK